MKTSKKAAKTDSANGYYKVVTSTNHKEVWARGFSNTEKPQRLIAEGYFHKYMYESDKHKTLIVIPE